MSNNEELFSEIFGEKEKKDEPRISNLVRCIILNYTESTVELVKLYGKNKVGVKLIEGIFTKENDTFAELLTFIICVNNDVRKKIFMKYSLDLIGLEILLKENAEGIIDSKFCETDYFNLNNRQRLREKCEKVCAKHYLICISIVDKMLIGDMEGLKLIAENVAKKFKQVAVNLEKHVS